MTETPETPTPSLAARLERYGRGTPKMDGSEVVPLPKYRDRPGQVIAILPAPVVADLRAAAAQLRQLDRIKAELRGEHVPQWSTPEMEARGKDPIGCVMCWPQDGSWPCVTILILEADDG